MARPSSAARKRKKEPQQEPGRVRGYSSLLLCYSFLMHKQERSWVVGPAAGPGPEQRLRASVRVLLRCCAGRAPGAHPTCLTSCKVAPH